MYQVDFGQIVRQAWEAYSPHQPIRSIEDISMRVSTNHVFKINLPRHRFVIAKLSYFGKYDHFREDHHIINVLANNLPMPYQGLLASSLMQGDELYCYRHQDSLMDVWVVFYNPVRIDRKLPKRLEPSMIRALGRELARFHLTCTEQAPNLPASSKTLKSDLEHLLSLSQSEIGKYEHRGNQDAIADQCERFLAECDKLNTQYFARIPVFVDWNIGNFSVDRYHRFSSRWDYDWFRMSSRMMDFYFMSRVVSDIGDKTVFSYTADQLMEERFIIFLKAYHKEFPLTEPEVRFLKEAYRFFLLNYVIKDGRYFFHEIYATRLQQEAIETYLPAMDEVFDPVPLLKALKL